MSKVRVAAFSISLDGFGAGPRQDLDNPLGVRGLELHRWFLDTEGFKKMHGQSGGTKGIDNDFALQSFENVGAWILGRNMFGPVRGPWTRRFLERVVGRQSAVPHACLRAHASRAAQPHDGRRHHVPLRHRWTGSCSQASQRSSQRQRCPNRRRRIRHSSVSDREPDRRDAPGHVTRPPGRRRASIFRNQSLPTSASPPSKPSLEKTQLTSSSKRDSPLE